MSTVMGMPIGLGLGNQGGAAGFTPTTLFAASEKGAWYDPSDLGSVWADTAATTPATVNGAVARINDKSANGNHAIQATAANRPILRQSGAIYYLEFDGVNDFLTVAFVLPQPISRVAGIRQVAWAFGAWLMGGGAGVTAALFQTGVTPALALYDGATAASNSGAAVGADVVTTEVHNGAGSSLTVDAGTATTGNPGAGVPGGITLGNDPAGGSPSAVRIYAVTAIDRLLTAPEQAKLLTWTAAKQGRTL